MVAHEDDHKAAGAGDGGEAVLAAVGAGQVEDGGRTAEIAHRWVESGHGRCLGRGFRPRRSTNLPGFYCREPLAPGAHVELPDPVARHAVRVLRLAAGAGLVCLMGGGEYPARIERIERERVVAAVGAWDAVERESTLAVTLVQALQAGEKMDYTIQKAVELGVAAIVPVESRRSVTRLSGERAGRRVAHWQGVAAAACEQCGRNQVPSVAPVDAWKLAGPAFRRGLASHAGAGGRADPGGPAPDVPGAVAHRGRGRAGCAGGAGSGAVGIRAVRLGPRVLRTETAGLAALAAMQTLWGDFRGV